MTKKIKVIGIDPAPSKKSTIFDGKEFWEKDFEELESYIDEIRNSNDKVLLCWDAPLSFSMKHKKAFTKRPIERFFSKKEGMKTPKGISVLGYAGCPHWTISQYILGYPKIYEFEKKFNPPFDLVFDKDKIQGHSVTEVHPAVAIWLWCECEKESDFFYKGKKNKTNRDRIISVLKDKSIITTDVGEISTDDKLDAYIAWKLGIEWLKKTGEVEILGNNETGSFLLPDYKGMKNKFDDFLKNKKA